MRSQYLSLFAALSPIALANFKFTEPVAGSVHAAGEVTVTWENDASTTPDIDLLTTYTLYCMVGGNEDTNSLQIYASDSTGEVSDLTTTADITAGLAGDTTDGFYFKILAVYTDGGTVTAYSDRFTMSGMTGTTAATYADAVEDLTGDTDVPTDVDDITTATATAAAAAGTDEFTVAYALQTGLTKYAPMQPIPATTITATSYSMLNPTSAYTLATTYLAAASIVTTLTESQTSTVSSWENTASAAALPSNDMRRFLNRWKD